MWLSDGSMLLTGHAVIRNTFGATLILLHMLYDKLGIFLFHLVKLYC